MKLHPALIGVITAVDVALAVLLALTLSAYDCGRITSGGIVLALFFIVSIMSFGLIYLVPGIVAGMVAAKVAGFGNARLWLTISGALALMLVIVVATQAPQPPVPFPKYCEVGM